MKKAIVILIALFALTLTAQTVKREARGVWMSAYVSDWPSGAITTSNAATMKKACQKMLDTLAVNNMNVVYFHVRAMCDALYNSAYEPWSSYCSTARGVAPAFDPLEFIVQEAHKRGIELYAWVNPYRYKPRNRDTWGDDPRNYENSHPEWLLATDYETVLNPGIPEVRQRVVDVCRDIISKYDVDGLVFDDYFYNQDNPSMTLDAEQYNAYLADGGTMSQADWRRENVNQMVHDVNQMVKQTKPWVRFGISPAGNIDYCKKIGADVETWLSEDGYVDYIVPQIYWSDNYILEGEKTKLFTERLKEWREINVNDVPMYIGLALYKAGYRLKEDPGWTKTSKNIVNQLNKIKNGNTEGYVLFAYVDLYQSHASKEVKNYLAKITTLSLNCSKKTLRAGKTYRLKATASLKRVQNAIKWKSANRKVATVSKNGTVKAKKKGKTKIYAYYGSKKKSCQIRVK